MYNWGKWYIYIRLKSEYFVKPNFFYLQVGCKNLKEIYLN